MTPSQFAQALRATLEAQRNPAIAEPMKRYMKNRFEFLGLKRPALKLAAAPFLKIARANAEEKWLTDAARRLWKRPEREYIYIAIDILSTNQKRLTPASLPSLEKWILEKSWWDSVDGISGQVLSPLVLRHPELRTEMDRWSRAPDFWLRRAAILHQLNHKKHTDAGRLFEYCARHARDNEFFIRKAIGWALRQHARIDPQAVRKFVESHPELSPLSRREAMKWL